MANTLLLEITAGAKNILNTNNIFNFQLSNHSAAQNHRLCLVIDDVSIITIQDCPYLKENL